MIGKFKTVNILLLIIGLAIICLPHLVYADNCTTTPGYQPQHIEKGGIVNTFIDLIQVKTTKLMEVLYTGFIKDSGYIPLYWTAVQLYVILYGLMIMFNLASTQPYEVLKKLFKFGIIAIFMSPQSWDNFNTYVIPATWGTMNSIIAIFSEVAIGFSGGQTPASGSLSKEPLMMLNAAFQMIFSLKYFVLVLATIFLSPIGFIYAFFLVLGAISIIRSVIGAVVTYFKVMILLSFLLGLAPIFIPLALFSETKKIFDGWVQQVVGTIMQPIMLFGFLSFFFVMISTTINKILGITNYCWVATDFMQGGPNPVNYWRPTVPGQLGTEEVRSVWGAYLQMDADDIIMLLVLSELAWRFSKYVADIGKDFGSGALNLVTSGGDIRKWSQDNLAKDNTSEALQSMSENAQESHQKMKEDLGDKYVPSKMETLAQNWKDGVSGRTMIKDWKSPPSKDSGDSAARPDIDNANSANDKNEPVSTAGHSLLGVGAGLPNKKNKDNTPPQKNDGDSKKTDSPDDSKNNKPDNVKNDDTNKNTP